MVAVREDTIWQGRVPPQNIDAERSVLGAMMLDEESREAVLEMMTGDHFYSPVHCIIFETIQKLQDKNTPADLITVTNKLKEIGGLDKIGGPGYLSGVVNVVPTVENATYYGRIIIEKAARREVIKRASIVAERAYNDDYDEMIDSVSSIDDHLQRIIGGSETDTKNIAAALTRRRKRIAAGEAVVIPSGFAKLDDLASGGLPRGYSTVIKALPGTGKTPFVLQMLGQMVEQGCKVLYISLELLKEDVWPRVVASRLKRRGMVDGSFDYTCLHNTHTWIADKPEIQAIEADEAGWFVDDRDVFTDDDIIRTIRMHVRKHGVQVVAIDYMNQVNMRDSSPDGRERFIDRLRVLYKSLRIVPIEVYQFDYKTESKQKDLGSVGNVRQFKTAEHGNAISIALKRKGKTDVREFIIGKDRFGRCGYFEMLFSGRSQTFLQ